MMTRIQIEEIYAYCKHAQKLLIKYGYPYHKVVIECESIEISDTIARLPNKDFLQEGLGN